jgi:hypothetical protein
MNAPSVQIRPATLRGVDTMVKERPAPQVLAPMSPLRTEAKMKLLMKPQKGTRVVPLERKVSLYP